VSDIPDLFSRAILRPILSVCFAFHVVRFFFWPVGGLIGQEPTDAGQKELRGLQVNFPHSEGASFRPRFVPFCGFLLLGRLSSTGWLSLSLRAQHVRGCLYVVR